MIFGAIDMGTNSCRMLMAKYTGGELTELRRGLRITRLGQGVDRDGYLNKNAISRARIAIKEFVTDMRNHGVREIEIIGTSALRDVNNAQDLINTIEKETGIKLRVISGEEEARLNYLGTGFSVKKNLIIDIGGGSTEFIWQEKGNVKYKSLNMGSVRMTERFITDIAEIVSDEDIILMKKNIQHIINNELDSLIEKTEVLPEKITGLGGTITTLAAIETGLIEYERERIHNYILTSASIKKILTKLSCLTLQQRKKVKGLQPGRADVIIAGTVILLEILKAVGLNKIVVSEHDLLYGIIYQLGEKYVSP